VPLGSKWEISSERDPARPRPRGNAHGRCYADAQGLGPWLVHQIDYSAAADGSPAVRPCGVYVHAITRTRLTFEHGVFSLTVPQIGRLRTKECMITMIEGDLDGRGQRIHFLSHCSRTWIPCFHDFLSSFTHQSPIDGLPLLHDWYEQHIFSRSCARVIRHVLQ
jgi:hypothetical protein